MRVMKTVGLIASFLLLGTTMPLLADDTQLLQESGSEVTVLLLIDTSMSMATHDMSGNPVISVDDPDSRLHVIRDALYNAFKDESNINLGMVSYTRDEVRVTAKHYLYNVDSISSSLPLSYPAAGDELIFGALYTDTSGTLIPGGTCDAPLSLSSQREAINTYAKLGADSVTPTEIWVAASGKTYRMTFSSNGASDKLGNANLVVKVDVDRLGNGANACDGPTFTGSTSQASINLSLVRQMIVTSHDDDEFEFTSEQKDPEQVGDTHWAYSAIQGDFTCGPNKPFSGDGAEFNDDDAQDTYCDGADCLSLGIPTIADPTGHPELSSGDAVLLHPSENRRTQVLNILNPKHGGGEEYGLASLMTDTVDPGTGSLMWANTAERTFIPGGASPLSDVALDLRCYISGPNVAKCRRTTSPFPTGYADLAEQLDPGGSQCNEIFFIFVTDAENNCAGENPTADIAGFYSALGVRSFVFVANDNIPAGTRGAINSIVQPGKGEVIFTGTADEFKDELLRVVALILEQQRTFASAAIPTVSFDITDSLFLSEFRPFNSTGYWEGHLRSFQKPLPLTPTGEPDLDHPNFLWDAGDKLLLQAPDPDVDDLTSPLTNTKLRLGSLATERRVYYPLADDGSVPRKQRLFAPPAAELGLSKEEIAKDLWQGMGLVDSTFAPSFDPLDGVQYVNTVAVNTEMEDILRDTYKIRTQTITNPDLSTEDIDYILGGIFHSNPVVIGSPANSFYEIENLHNYQDFSLQQLRRRKVLIGCTKRGFCHGFDAGVFRRADGEFDTGTGRELFAVAGRSSMLASTALSQTNAHQWGIDGNPAVTDIFVDPEHTGTPTAADREWRTIMMVGGRRGTNSYLVIDLTDPDPVQAVLDTGDGSVLGYVPDESDLPINSDYPAIRFEFSDPGDEDGNGFADLEQTWSTPNLGRVQVVEGGSTVEKFVAVFGGGLGTGGGNWLYMVDLETGKAIYKEPLDSAAPSAPAAVDTDADGFLDRIYIGTVGGYMYRADIGDPKPLVLTSGEYRVTDTAWEPYVVFDTATTASGVTTRRPIYFPPQVLFVGELGLYALAFGTGDRENLWSSASADGERFYVFTDDTELPGVNAPLTEDDFEEVIVEGAATGTDFLSEEDAGERGWFFKLDESLNERTLNEATTFPFTTVFSTFLPETIATPTGTGNNTTTTCQRTGNSRIYTVFSGDGNPLAETDTGPERFQEVTDFTTDPYIENRATGNEIDDTYQDPLESDPRLQSIWEALKEQFPRTCRFSTSRGYDVKVIRSDTGVEQPLSIPICRIDAYPPE